MIPEEMYTLDLKNSTKASSTTSTLHNFHKLWSAYHHCDWWNQYKLIIPNTVTIKLNNHQYFKVSSETLRQSSRFFDALIRFNFTNNTVLDHQHGNNDEDREAIEIVENHLNDAFVSILNDLIVMNEENNDNDSKIFKMTDENIDSHRQSQHRHQHHHYCHHRKSAKSSSDYSLDFLFDCILLCSKYFFDFLERSYSDRFIQKLRLEATDLAVTDIIRPPSLSKNDLHANNYLSMLDMLRLAKVYNLDYLTFVLNELIKEKRAFFLKRLRATYYW